MSAGIYRERGGGEKRAGLVVQGCCQLIVEHGANLGIAFTFDFSEDLKK